MDARAGQFAGVTAIAQHGHAVCYFLDFFETVGDIDDADAVFGEFLLQQSLLLENH